jgi:serine/threonine protein kinase
MQEGRTFKIGQYARVNRLGLSALGETYLVQEKTTHEYFVIKSFRAPVHANEDLARHLDRLASVAHPLVHPIKAYCLPDAARNRPLAVLSDYLPASLAGFLASKPLLTNCERLNMIFGVAEALRHIYSLGLSHRSLTARNVLLTDSREVRVSDFGFGAVTDNVVPPFALDCNQAETESSLDCFCFGLLAWSVLTGEVWQRRSPPRVDDRIHSSFQDLITGYLNRDYLRRRKFDVIVLRFLRDEFVLPLSEAA